MSRIAVISDTHFGHSTLIDLSVAVRAFKAAIDAAAILDTKTLLHCGDLTDEAKLDGYVLNALAEVLDYAKDRGVEVLILDGNHGLDRKGKSALEHLGIYQFPHIKIFAYEPSAIKIAGQDFLMLPYGQDVLDARNAALGLKDPILVAHDTIVGAHFDNDQTAKIGLDLHMIQNSGFKAGFFGHIHKPQMWLAGDKPFLYVGSNLQFNFRGAGQVDRGYLIYDLDSNAYDRHPMVGDEWPVFEYHSWAGWTAGEGIRIGNPYYVTIDAEEGDPPSDEIEKIVMSNAVTKCWVRRNKKEQVKTPRRSAISMDDSYMVMASKYTVEVLPEDQQDDALQALNKFLLGIKP